MSGFIRTHSGKNFYPLDARPEDVRIEDIAHSLSHQCRWAGHTSRFYSVALHAIHVSMMLPREHAFAGLNHDNQEAFMCDLPAPVKRGMPEYSAHEDRLAEVIGNALGYQFPFSAEVKRADAAALYLESQYFFSFEREIPNVTPPRQSSWNFDIVCSATPPQVRDWFLQEYHRLKALTKTQ